MKSNLALTNVSFSFLKGSSEFLNLVLNNINSCILLLNRDMQLVAFNNSLRTIFSRKKDEELELLRCGEAIGCAYQVEEEKDCGTTTQCAHCELREAAINSYMKDEAIYMQRVDRPFFNFMNQKVIKHLDFSTRLFRFNGEKYIILIVEDVSRLAELEFKLKSKEG